MTHPAEQPSSKLALSEQAPSEKPPSRQPLSREIVEPVPRSAIRWSTTVAVAVVLHYLCGLVLGGHDVIAAVTTARSPWLILVALALVPTRLFLFLLAPGWALHIFIVTVLTRRLTDRT